MTERLSGAAVGCSGRSGPGADGRSPSGTGVLGRSVRRIPPEPPAGRESARRRPASGGPARPSGADTQQRYRSVSSGWGRCSGLDEHRGPVPGRTRPAPGSDGARLPSARAAPRPAPSTRGRRDAPVAVTAGPGGWGPGESDAYGTRALPWARAGSPQPTHRAEDRPRRRPLVDVPTSAGSPQPRPRPDRTAGGPARCRRSARVPLSVLDVGGPCGGAEGRPPGRAQFEHGGHVVVWRGGVSGRTRERPDRPRRSVRTRSARAAPDRDRRRVRTAGADHAEGHAACQPGRRSRGWTTTDRRWSTTSWPAGAGSLADGRLQHG